ncbi:tetratricopeptide repeat protein [Streptomyces sp. TRM64462]|uniref:tetratricopeptide repeat protein n=1 Tax=Streptomyces sp. TRM64462 TaxID=2741726 RepID=UPI002814D869|nr:tetratricopeptide repeat protein [Streptomyces sp. TRM64462]
MRNHEETEEEGAPMLVRKSLRERAAARGRVWAAACGRLWAGARGRGEPAAVRGREPAAASRRRRMATVVAVAAGLTAASVAIGPPDGPAPPARDDRSGRAASVRTGDVATAALTSRDLARGIDGLQRHLKARPKDAAGWAALGAAYVEEARVSGDPARYPRAQEAFARSLRLRPAGDNDAALAGQAALAAARHDFGAALRLADRALRVNPYGERALATRVDALVELGRYGDARRAVELADRRRPGIPVFTRYAYVLELHGDVAGARRVLERALDSAFGAGDRAYVATELGQLALGQGRFREALRHYATALRAEPGYVPALEGRGRAHAGLGEAEAAVRDLEEAVRRGPLPGRLAALGELYEAAGRPEQAARQYALVGTWTRLARANGVATDLDAAVVEADHGDAAAALASARSAWSRRQTVHTADALAWALHANGRHKEALLHAKTATAGSPGYRNASFLFHRGMIERALGDDASARRHLRAALALNPGFSPVGAREARAVLGGPARGGS